VSIDTSAIESAIATAVFGSIVLTGVILLFMLINMIHRWKSEKAMVEMQKDIRQIRLALEKVTATDAQPQLNQTTIASQPNEPTQ